MRGTLHLVPAEDIAWLVPLTAAAHVAGSLRRLAQLGVSSDRAERAVAAIERMLAARGPLTRAEIAERLRRARVPKGQAVIHLIRLAALRGLVCYAADADSQEKFVLVRDWLGHGDPMEDAVDDASLAEFAARYLAAHGPAGPDDLATWSGLRSSDVRRAWAELGDRLTEVSTPAGLLWRLRRSSARRATRPVVRLVPEFDPFLLGWRSRALTLPKRHERKVFPGGGMFRPAVLADGVAVATWSVARRGDPRDLTVRPFGRLDVGVRAAIEEDAADVVRFLEPGAHPEVSWE